MCDPEGNGLESMMGVFRLPNVDIRVSETFLIYIEESQRFKALFKRLNIVGQASELALQSLTV